MGEACWWHSELNHPSCRGSSLGGKPDMVPSPWVVCDGGGTCLPRDRMQAQTVIPTEGAGPPSHEHTGHVSVPPLEDGGQFSAGRACRQGPGQQPQNSEKCSLSPPREPCSQHSLSSSSGFRGQRTWESLQGGIPRLVLKIVTHSSQDSCLLIP